MVIDGTTLRARDGGPGAGIEQYTRMISSVLIQAAGTSVRVVEPWGRLPFVSRHVSVPLQAVLGRADVLFCPSGHIPLGWFGRAAIVVHDLAIHEHPEWFPSPPSPLDARSIRRAETVIAVSEATKQQIARLFPEAAEKTVVVYPGVTQPLNHSTTQPLNDSILFVGTLEPRKNLENAIAAFDAFLRMHPDRAATARFILAGKLGWKSEAIVEAIAQTNEAWRKKAGEDVVRPVGYVNEAEKEALYRQASCLLFPSWYEGFGLPVLEAMAAGTPVVTTNNRGAIPEVGGDAVIYVEPDDIEQMALAIAQCVMLPDAMEEMIEAAKKRASQFTWQRAASEILSTISSANTR